jgi:hypothetical protein
VQRNVVAAMVSTRVILRGENNWKLFATTVEAFLHRAGEKPNEGLPFEGLTRHREWYLATASTATGRSCTGTTTTRS